MRHTFSCFWSFVPNMERIHPELYATGWTRKVNGQTDRQTDRVIPIYPLTSLWWWWWWWWWWWGGGEYNNHLRLDTREVENVSFVIICLYPLVFYMNLNDIEIIILWIIQTCQMEYTMRVHSRTRIYSDNGRDDFHSVAFGRFPISCEDTAL